MTAQVFVVASASMTALGEQQKLTTAQMLRPTMVDIQVEDHTVPYYAMKGPLLTKSFSLMAKFPLPVQLSEGIGKSLTVSPICFLCK